MDRDREYLLGVVLADDVVVEDLADLLWGRNLVAGFRQRRLVLLADDVHAKLDALVANKDRGPGNELAHLVLALAAERAVERILRVAAANLAHFRTPKRCESLQSLPRRINQARARSRSLRTGQLGFPSTERSIRSR